MTHREIEMLMKNAWPELSDFASKHCRPAIDIVNFVDNTKDFWKLKEGNDNGLRKEEEKDS